MSAKGSILVIDDETEIRESLEQLLKLKGYLAVTTLSRNDVYRKRLPSIASHRPSNRMGSQRGGVRGDAKGKRTFDSGHGGCGIRLSR